MGRLSDGIGRKKVIAGGSVLYAGFFFAFLWIIDSHMMGLAIAANVLMSLLMAMPQGCIPAFLGEQFSKESRYSSISATYQIGAAVGGGTAASIATALLIAFGGSPIGVTLYSAAACAVIVVCALGLRETYKVPTADLGR